jgi:antitoxin (DNA-binding transcriptional repressor) of toxin-antitoxin stability system
MGQIVGSTNDKGEHPRDRPLTYQCLLATIYHALGIDPAHTFINQAGRPVPILPTGEPIAELTGVNSRNDGRAKSASPTKSSLHEPGARPNGGRTVALPAGATNADLAALQDRGNLDTLVLHDARIDDDGLAAIADCRSLRCLQLNGTPATDNGLVHLGKLTALEELNLTGTRTTDAGLAHLKPLARLRRLAFNGTSVSLGGVVRLFVHDQRRPLVEALSAMGLTSFDDQGSVVAINVAGMSFGDEELQHLGPLTTLRELHLAATRVTDQGMAHVGDLANLERLYLAKCEVSDAGLAHVARLIRLRAINLYGTKLTSAGLEHLSGLEQLRLLSVTDVKLNPAAVDQLKSKLPGLTVTDYTPV